MDRPDGARPSHTRTTYERDTDTRWAHRNLGGWWWLALLAVPLLLAGVVALARGGSMENDLGARSTAALDKAGLTGVSVDFDGRDATVSVAPDATLSADDLKRAEGLIADVEGVRVVNVDDAGAAAEQPSDTPTGVTSDSASPACDATTTQAAIDQILGEDKIQFGESSARVEGAAADEVAQVAQALSGCDLAITVSGHTDVYGAKGRLSQARGDAVAAALEGAGISAELITVEARGDSEPLGDDTTAAGRDMNRYANIQVR